MLFFDDSQLLKLHITFLRKADTQRIKNTAPLKRVAVSDAVLNTDVDFLFVDFYVVHDLHMFLIFLSPVIVLFCHCFCVGVPLGVLESLLFTMPADSCVLAGLF